MCHAYYTRLQVLHTGRRVKRKYCVQRANCRLHNCINIAKNI